LLLAIATATAADMYGTRSREWQMLLALTTTLGSVISRQLITGVL